jgi:hypothetical protein
VLVDFRVFVVFPELLVLMELAGYLVLLAQTAHVESLVLLALLELVESPE